MSASALATNKLNERLPFLALLATTLAYLYFRFEKVFKCPSCYLYSDGGDGLKNYFTSVFYVSHDKGLWFHGMNYPYGEHPVYTDNQPVWSLLMKLVGLIFPMQQHVVGSINMLLIISLLVAVIAIYLLLREFNLPRWYAALVSLPIVFLSPQIERFNGHYSLAYVCYIPLFLLLFIRWQKNLTWKRGLGVLLFIVWTGFTHLYFFFISVAFMLAFWIVLWIRNGLRWKKSLSRILVLVVCTGIAVYLPVKLTDPIKDRPKQVYGMYVFAAKPAGTFLPWYGSWAEKWTKECDIKAIDGESRSYLGIAGVLLAPLVLIYAIRNIIIRRRRNDSDQVSDTSPGVLGWSAFLVWFMAAGWFYLAGGSVLIEAFPVLGQFRSLGRLAWVFYFGYLCFAAWLVYHGITSMKRRWLQIVCGVIASLLFITWIYEAHIYSTITTQNIYHENNFFRGDKPYLDVLRQHNMQPDDFQAILQLPLVIIGTENLPVHRGHWEFGSSAQCAWETGLPIVDYNMSRTSVSHALSLLQLISTPDIPKTRLEDMNDKPLLLLTHISQLIAPEKRLIALADSLGTVGHMSVYKLDIEDFNVPLPMDTTQWEILVHEGFEQSPSKHTFLGNGAHHSTRDATFLSYTDTTATSTLNFSCWLYLAADVPIFPPLRVLQYDPNGNQLEEQIHSIHSFNPWQVKGNWIEITFPLQAKMKGARFDISTLAEGARIDEVVIKKVIGNPPTHASADKSVIGSR